MSFLRFLFVIYIALKYQLDEYFSSNLIKFVRLVLKPFRLFSRNKYNRAERLRMALENLGPIFVKFGQMLSTRRDLLPKDIADELALSRSKLYRKIKELTGKSANEMIRKMRLEKSKELLEITEMTIGEICYKVGFSSPSYYTKRFKEYTGLIPKEYRLVNKEKKELLIENE